MISRISIFIVLSLVVLVGCTPTRDITYSVKGIEKVSLEDSVHARTHTLGLRIALFEDVRQAAPENGILFLRERETEVNGMDYCINSEKHYKKGTVPAQVAKIMATHIDKRGTFKKVTSDSTALQDYVLTGKITRLYSAQEVSTSAKVGSFFGLIGALATSGATTNGEVVIEFSDLAVRRASDGVQKRIPDVAESFSGELHADAECWCVYDNLNDRLKLAVERLSVAVEQAVAELAMSKP
jgi:hypothetical protein